MTVDGRYYTLYIVPKMEWYGNSSHRWNPNASETRYVSLTRDCTVRLTDGIRGKVGPSYVHLSKGANVIGNWNIFITDDMLNTTSNYAYWDIDIRGNIFQMVLVDTNSAWNFEGYPLW